MSNGYSPEQMIDKVDRGIQELKADNKDQDKRFNRFLEIDMKEKKQIWKEINKVQYGIMTAFIVSMVTMISILVKLFI